MSPESMAQWEEVLGLAGRMVYAGSERAEFLKSFRRIVPSVMPDFFTEGRTRPEDTESMAGALGFALWRSMPNPRHGWRPAPAPLPGRNEPCYCGSGQKFKRCCATLAVPTRMFDGMNLLRYVLDAYPAARFADIVHERLDPMALADTADQWQIEGDVQRAAQLLEPLFSMPKKLGARHVESFDVLMDAWLVLDRPRKRKALVAALMEHPDSELAAAARLRKVTMLADQDDWDGAWTLFQSSLRRTPDHPQFAQLEVTLLMMQGRENEARARATFWARRLRQLDPDYADYADEILEMAHDPDRLAAPDATTASPLLDSLNALLQAAPVPAIAYAVGTETSEITLEPTRELERIEAQWRRRFPLQKPQLTLLESDPRGLLDEADAAAAFLRKNPLAWQSFEILDDLALVAYWMSQADAARSPWFALQRRLGVRGEALLCTLLPQTLASPAPSDEEVIPALLQLMASVDAGGPTFPWGFPENRPALRLIALQIDARLFMRPADPRIPQLMAWLIRLNPNDNHGYRTLLAQQWLKASQPEAALALMDRFPDDIGTAPADRMLALVMLDRLEEAEALLGTEGRWLAKICRGLLAKGFRQPREVGESFVELGGRAEAWRYRQEMRATWERTGALRWLAAQPQPQLKAQPRPKPQPRPKARRGVKGPGRDAESPPGAGARDAEASPSPVPSAIGAARAPGASASPDAGRQRFAQLGGDLVRAHGILVATAMAPDVVSPNAWISLVLQSSGDSAPASTPIDGANAVLGAMVTWYNAIVLEIGPAARGEPRMGVQSKPHLDEQTAGAVSRWAGGFVDCVSAEPAAWRRLGSNERSKLLAPLNKMAMRAPLSAAEKSDPSRIRDRADDAPLLTLVDDGDPVELLTYALDRLVEAVATLRSMSAARRR